MIDGLVSAGHPEAASLPDGSFLGSLIGAVCRGLAGISSHMCPTLPFLNTVRRGGCLLAWLLDCVRAVRLGKGGFAPTLLLQKGARAMARIFMWPKSKFGITEEVLCLNIQTQTVHIQSDRYLRPADECRHNGVYICIEWPGNIHGGVKPSELAG